MTGGVGAEVAAALAGEWRTFREHRPVGAYLLLGQLDGDCMGCNTAWPCPTVLDALAPLIAARVEAAKAEALRDAADAVANALANEIGSGHTSTYSVRRWLRDRAAALESTPREGQPVERFCGECGKYRVVTEAGNCDECGSGPL